MLSRGRFWVVLPHPKASACAWWIPLIHIKRCAFCLVGSNRPLSRSDLGVAKSCGQGGGATCGEWLAGLEN